jgi:hypothetical protein
MGILEVCDGAESPNMINIQHHKINGPHRMNSPAIEWANGDKEWWSWCERHREDGPAVEGIDGSKLWYLFRLNYSEEEWKIEVEKIRKNNSK